MAVQKEGLTKREDWFPALDASQVGERGSYGWVLLVDVKWYYSSGKVTSTTRDIEPDCDFRWDAARREGLAWLVIVGG